MNKQGDRVRLIECRDEYTFLNPGDEGTVAFIDSVGTVHTNWENGASLGLVPGEDRWETLKEEDGKERQKADDGQKERARHEKV